MNTHFYVGGLKLAYPIILGTGVCKDPGQLSPYMRADSSYGAVVVGSVTQDARPQNEGVVQWPESYDDFIRTGSGFNSFGMPNPGIEKFLKRLTKVPLLCPGIVSIAGFSAEEYAHCAQLANACKNVSAIEINWGCGNTGKLPAAYSYENAHAILQALENLSLSSDSPIKPLWIKLSPYITVKEHSKLAAQHPDIDFSAAPVVKASFPATMVRLIAQYPFVKAIVFSNTLANCRKLGSGNKPVTTPFGGKAGLSGPILKEISLRLIREAHAALPSRCDIGLIHCGGVLHGDDAADAFVAGAVAVQCTSGPAWSRDGPRFATDLIAGSDRLQQYLSRD